MNFSERSLAHLSKRNSSYFLEIQDFLIFYQISQEHQESDQDAAWNKQYTIYKLIEPKIFMFLIFSFSLSKVYTDLTIGLFIINPFLLL